MGVGREWCEYRFMGQFEDRSIPSAAEVLVHAAQILAVRYPNADSAFVAGSLMRGEGSTTSDIDLVVLHASLPQAWRESFLFSKIPVEAFVHDPETLSWFLDHDREDGHPALIGMLIEGVVIGPRPEIVHDFKVRAVQIYEQGPPPLSPEAVEKLRYTITDKLDDLATDRPAAERIAIGAALYPLLVELALRGNNCWNGSGKWNARLLHKMDASIAMEFESAFLNLYNGSETRAVLRLADRLLEPHGGRLFAGYRSDAPAIWRNAYSRKET